MIVFTFIGVLTVSILSFYALRTLFDVVTYASFATFAVVACGFKENVRLHTKVMATIEVFFRKAYARLFEFDKYAHRLTTDKWVYEPPFTLYRRHKHKKGDE